MLIRNISARCFVFHRYRNFLFTRYFLRRRDFTFSNIVAMSFILAKSPNNEWVTAATSQRSGVLNDKPYFKLFLDLTSITASSKVRPAIIRRAFEFFIQNNSKASIFLSGFGLTICVVPKPTKGDHWFYLTTRLKFDLSCGNHQL